MEWLRENGTKILHRSWSVIRSCPGLREEKEMKWWKSVNGVVLTEGVCAAAGNEDDDTMQKTVPRASVRGLVPIKYFEAVIEIKQGMGLLYAHDRGVVKQLPEDLKRMAVPSGKDREHGPRKSRGRGQGRGSGNIVERSDV